MFNRMLQVGLLVGVLITGIHQAFANPKTELRFKLKKENISPQVFMHKNLQIFLLKGQPQLDSKTYMTLSEAMEKDLVTVGETGNVQQLFIKNNSKDNYIFILSGDIVKGGKQDRTVRYDMIIPPQSKKIPLASFCVESGRWSKRSGERVDKFSSNDFTLSSKRSRIAAKYQKNQSEVWNSVAEQQSKISSNMFKLSGKKVDVRSKKSASSLQLTLENKELKKVIAAYKESFKDIVLKEPTVMGFAYAINGKVNTIDFFNSKPLFLKLWPKLLDAAIAEAVADYNKSLIHNPLPPERILDTYNSGKAPKIDELDLNSETEFITYDSKELIIFETIDKKAENWIHQNVIKKDPGMQKMRSRHERNNDIQLNTIPQRQERLQMRSQRRIRRRNNKK